MVNQKSETKPVQYLIIGLINNNNNDNNDNKKKNNNAQEQDYLIFLQRMEDQKAF